MYLFDLPGYGASERTAGDISRRRAEPRAHRPPPPLGRRGSLRGSGTPSGGDPVLRTHLLDRGPAAGLALVDPVALSPWGSPFFRPIAPHEEGFAGVPGFVHRAIATASLRPAAPPPVVRGGPQALARTLAPSTGAPGPAAFYRPMAQADSRLTAEAGLPLRRSPPTGPPALGRGGRVDSRWRRRTGCRRTFPRPVTPSSRTAATLCRRKTRVASSHRFIPFSQASPAIPDRVPTPHPPPANAAGPRPGAARSPPRGPTGAVRGTPPRESGGRGGGRAPAQPSRPRPRSARAARWPD